MKGDTGSLVNRTKSISHNKLKGPLNEFYKKSHIIPESLIFVDLLELFSRLDIGCQNRDGNLKEFFRHENQHRPPASLENGKLNQCTNSDLLFCLGRKL